MPGVGIDDFGASFIKYRAGIIQTLNSTVKARLIPKGDVKWEGVHLEKKVQVRRNVAIGSPQDGGAIPSAGKATYVPAKVARKFVVGSVKVTDGILANAATTENAAITVNESELQGLMDGLRKWENFMFGRDGTGIVGLLGATTSGATITVTDARMMWEGAQFEIRDTAAPTTIHATFTVSKINRAFNSSGEAVITPTASVASGSQAQGDYIVWLGNGGDASYGNVPMGLDGMIDDAVTGTFQTVDVATYNRYTSPVLDNGGTLRPLKGSLFRQMAAAIKQESGDDVGECTVLGNHWEAINTEEMYEGEIRLSEHSTVAGFKVARFQSTLGTFDVMTDPDMPYNKLYFIDAKQISRAVQKELDWRPGTKGPFTAAQNSLNHTANCVEIVEFFIDQRNRCGKIEDLRETKATAFG